MEKVQLLAEVEDLLRTMPDQGAFIQRPSSTNEWSGRACAVMRQLGVQFGVPFAAAVASTTGGSRATQDNALQTVPRLLHEARFTLRMETVGPISAAVDVGAVFDYFDEVRKIIESASADLLFVDPYIDAEFVARYLPHVKAGVQVRLLTRKGLEQLLPAAQAFTAQHDIVIAIRTSSSLHDRFVIVDGAAGYQSGASFKDGAKRSPTTLTQITDTFAVVRQQYEDFWSVGQVRV